MSEARIFHFNEHRSQVVDEVTRRVVAQRKAAAAANPDESLEYVLNDEIGRASCRERVCPKV